MNILSLAKKKDAIECDPEVASMTEAISAIAQAKVLTIRDDGQEKRYSEMFVQARKLEKALDARRRYYTDPLDREKKSIKAFFDSLAEPVRKKITELDGVLRKWRVHKEEEARKSREKAEKERQRIQTKLEKQGMGDIQVPEIITPKRETTTRTESGTVSERKTWKVEVIDIKTLCRAVADGEVPVECVEAKIGNLQALARMGRRTIPGCRVWQETSIGARG